MSGVWLGSLAHRKPKQSKTIVTALSKILEEWSKNRLREEIVFFVPRLSPSYVHLFLTFYFEIILDLQKWRLSQGLAHDFPLSVHLSFPLFSSKGPHDTCGEGSNGQQQLVPDKPPEPVPTAPFSLTPQ